MKNGIGNLIPPKVPEFGHFCAKSAKGQNETLEMKYAQNNPCYSSNISQLECKRVLVLENFEAQNETLETKYAQKKPQISPS